ncbi:conserved unknown protein [Ectocarpus siliculosus]|uniref:EsV-1-7 n=1 Tax=Ectocarpus siliculosus TaxID=2880 RepID=D7G4L4_ECTSI|nr:conserved unknown protein [Ectocarpus siliculosus]|eukprot:CBJ48917.1 conserved unknown protein [Ectocarpus siliculosus]
MADAGTTTAELTAVAEDLAKTSAKIESVEMALSGQGVYLGITDKDTLLSQLDVLQKKEAQLQTKELFIMAAVAGASASAVQAASISVAFPPVGALPTGTAPASTDTSMEELTSSSSSSSSSTTTTTSATAAAVVVPVPATAAGSSGGGGGGGGIAHGGPDNSSGEHGDATTGQDGHHVADDSDFGGAEVGGQEVVVPDGGDIGVASGAPSPTVEAGAAQVAATLEGGGVTDVTEGVLNAGVTPAAGYVSGGGGDGGAVGVVHGDVQIALASPHQLLAQSPAPELSSPTLHVNGAPGAAAELPPSLEAVGVSPAQHHAAAAGGASSPAEGARGEEYALAGRGASLLGRHGGAIGAHVGVVGGGQGGAVGCGGPLRSVKRRAGDGGAGISQAAGSNKRRARASARCQYPGCMTARTFGRQGDRQASFCAVHKEEGMINIKGRRCNSPGCQHRPGFAMPGEKRGKFCASHRQPGMIDVVRSRAETVTVSLSTDGRGNVPPAAGHTSSNAR